MNPMQRSPFSLLIADLQDDRVAYATVPEPTTRSWFSIKMNAISGGIAAPTPPQKWWCLDL
jgi:hypothetical protein